MKTSAFRIKVEDSKLKQEEMAVEEEESMRIVISAPDKNMPLEKNDKAFMLIQYEELDNPPPEDD